MQLHSVPLNRRKMSKILWISAISWSVREAAMIFSITRAALVAPGIEMASWRRTRPIATCAIVMPVRFAICSTTWASLKKLIEDLRLKTRHHATEVIPWEVVELAQPTCDPASTILFYGHVVCRKKGIIVRINIGLGNTGLEDIEWSWHKLVRVSLLHTTSDNNSCNVRKGLALTHKPWL